MKLQIEYQNFFLKSEAGKEFVNELGRLISTSHEKAEKDAEAARDFTQQAKGVRQVLEHIQSVTTIVKKGRTLK